MKKKLTARQKKFVGEYLIDLNATQAAIRAGYNEKTARQVGARLLTYAVIADAVAKAQEKRAARTEITQDRVLKELALLGFSNMSDYLRTGLNGEPTVLDFGQLSREQAAALQEVTCETGGDPDDDDGVTQIRKVKFKLYDKRAALVDIGKHLGMFKDVSQINLAGHNGGPLISKDDVSDAVAALLGGSVRAAATAGAGAAPSVADATADIGAALVVGLVGAAESTGTD